MQDSKPTPGQLLVAHAAQGRGFSEWNVKPESKASLEKARQAVKAAAKGKAGQLRAISCLCKKTNRKKTKYAVPLTPLVFGVWGCSVGLAG
eukprot:638873-Rhodomonas_salina.7